MWMAGNDAVMMSELQRMPLMEYYALVDKKIDEWKSHVKNEKKKNGVRL